eukprot:471595-Pyramimonas_sp.AAC.1
MHLPEVQGFLDGRVCEVPSQKCNGHPRCPRPAHYDLNRITAGRHPTSDCVWLDVDAVSVVRLFV